MKLPKTSSSLLTLASALALLAVPFAAQAQILQTVNDGGGGWNSALWGSPAAAPTGGNDYMTATGLMSSSATGLGTPDVTGRVRAISGQGTFAGDSLQIVTGTELLIKNSGTYTANITLNGGLIRHSPNTAINATLAGTLDVAADSVLGSVQSGAQAFIIASTITGSSTLRLAAGTGTNQTVTFDDGAGTSLNGFQGILDIGGGGTLVTVDINQAYAMTLGGVTMGDFSTVDVLNLDATWTVGSFAFNGASLSADTYSVSELNGMFGNGSQFTGSGSLIVVPEPATFAMLLGGMGMLALVRRRRA